MVAAEAGVTRTQSTHRAQNPVDGRGSSKVMSSDKEKLARE